MLPFSWRFGLLVIVTLTIVGCGKESNRVVDTQSDLWAQREAFYADDENLKQAE